MSTDADNLKFKAELSQIKVEFQAAAQKGKQLKAELTDKSKSEQSAGSDARIKELKIEILKVFDLLKSLDKKRRNLVDGETARVRSEIQKQFEEGQRLSADEIAKEKSGVADPPDAAAARRARLVELSDKVASLGRRHEELQKLSSPLPQGLAKTPTATPEEAPKQSSVPVPTSSEAAGAGGGEPEPAQQKPQLSSSDSPAHESKTASAPDSERVPAGAEVDVSPGPEDAPPAREEQPSAYTPPPYKVPPETVMNKAQYTALCEIGGAEDARRPAFVMCETPDHNALDLEWLEKDMIIDGQYLHSVFEMPSAVDMYAVFKHDVVKRRVWDTVTLYHDVMQMYGGVTESDYGASRRSKLKAGKNSGAGDEEAKIRDARRSLDGNLKTLRDSFGFQPLDAAAPRDGEPLSSSAKRLLQCADVLGTVFGGLVKCLSHRRAPGPGKGAPTISAFDRGVFLRMLSSADALSVYAKPSATADTHCRRHLHVLYALCSHLLPRLDTVLDLFASPPTPGDGDRAKSHTPTYNSVVNMLNALSREFDLLPTVFPAGEFFKVPAASDIDANAVAKEMNDIRKSDAMTEGLTYLSALMDLPEFEDVQATIDAGDHSQAVSDVVSKAMRSYASYFKNFVDSPHKMVWILQNVRLHLLGYRELFNVLVWDADTDDPSLRETHERLQGIAKTLRMHDVVCAGTAAPQAQKKPESAPAPSPPKKPAAPKKATPAIPRASGSSAPPEQPKPKSSPKKAAGTKPGIPRAATKASAARPTKPRQKKNPPPPKPSSESDDTEPESEGEEEPGPAIPRTSYSSSGLVINMLS